MSRNDLKYCACLAQKHHHVPNQKWRRFHKRRLSTLSKRRPCSPNTAPATKNTSETTSQFYQSRLTLANVWVTRRKCHSCHTDEEVSDVLHLSRKTPLKMSQMSQMSHAFEEKWTYRSKNEHRATVKVDLRKQEKRAKRLVRACAVEMHMGHLTSKELLCKPAQAQSKGPQPDPWSNPGPLPLRILTVRTPQCRHADGEKQNRLFKGHVCKRAKLDGEQETSHYLIWLINSQKHVPFEQWETPVLAG